MDIRLDGHVALVTGAGRGIGLGCSAALASAGARVIAVSRTQSDLEQLADHPSGRIETWSVDVTTDAFLERVPGIEGLSILVNNAGSNRPQPFADVDTQTLDAMLHLNVRTAFRVAQAAVQAMLRRDAGGSVIHLSSQMGHIGSPNRSVYCMTKHAVEGLTKAMAVELAPAGIRVNAVAPTFIETPLTRPMLEDATFRDFVLSMIPLGKVGQVEDVAAAVVYLASDAAKMVTGHSLRVDGGWTAQ